MCSLGVDTSWTDRDPRVQRLLGARWVLLGFGLVCGGIQWALLWCNLKKNFPKMNKDFSELPLSSPREQNLLLTD